MKSNLPKRKPNRLPFHDYSTPGAYFITICTHSRQKILSRITKNDEYECTDPVGATIGRPHTVILSEYGKIVDQAINLIHHIYPTVTVDHYVIMPNHIHLLLQLYGGESGRPMVAPTTDRIVRQMKGYISKKIGKPIWQKLYHDHVIRNQADYDHIWNYIETNPARWEYDCFYENN